MFYSCLLCYPSCSKVRKIKFLLTVCLFCYLPTCLFVRPSICCSLCLSVCLSTCLSAGLFSPCSTVRTLNRWSKRRFCSPLSLSSLGLSDTYLPTCSVRKLRRCSKHRFCSSPCHPSACVLSLLGSPGFTPNAGSVRLFACLCTYYLPPCSTVRKLRIRSKHRFRLSPTTCIRLCTYRHLLQ